MSTTTPTNTAEYPSGLHKVTLAAATLIPAGALVALNASGYAINAADVANARVIGRAEETADNSAGIAGAVALTVKRGVFAYKNDATNPCTIAHIGKKIYVKDNDTVQSATGTNSVVAGLMIGFDGDEVIVDTTLAPAL